ncbi:MAG: YcdB/YcdC domain-containing protein [Bacillota bacterium]
MKKLISFITVLALLAAYVIIPAAADETLNYDLEKALEIVKEKLELVTDGYEFNSSYSENYYNGRKVWDMHWYKSNGTGESMSATVDAMTGEIINYYSWLPGNQTYRKLPKYTQEEALKVAEEFLNRICPDKVENVKLYEDPYAKLYGYYNENYTFNYIRYIDGISFDGNNIYIGIDKNTLKVRNFNLNWDNSELPDISKVISKFSARKVLEEKQGLELTYQLIYPEGEKKPNAILTYSLKGNTPIDAITGELIYNSYYYPQHYSSYYGYEKMALARASMDSAVVITPEEQKEVEDTSKFITKETAIEAVKVYLPNVDEYVLSHANLNPSYGTENAQWYFNWNKNDEKSGKYAYISAAVDAITGEVKNFHKGDSDMYNTEGKEVVYTEEQGKEIAAEFLKKIQPEKFALTENYKYENNYPPDYKQPIYNYSFIKKVNGVFASFNSLYVGVSAYTGEIVSYSFYWVNVDLPSSENVITLDAAYDSLYKKADMALKYLKQYDYSTGMEKSAIKLAYVLDGFYGLIDANTGEIIGYDGKPYVEPSAEPFKFTDIEGHAAEADINLLLEVGVLDTASKEFAPDDKILQKDFIKMLVKATESPYNYYPMYDSSGKALDEYDYYYQVAIQKKFISENEKSPDGYLNRQEASKMIVRALGFGYLAEKSGMFMIPFEDSNQVFKAYKGYIVIAEEFGIFTAVENKFNPKQVLTRGDAATAIVNFLKIDLTELQ